MSERQRAKADGASASEPGGDGVRGRSPRREMSERQRAKADGASASEPGGDGARKRATSGGRRQIVVDEDDDARADRRPRRRIGRYVLFAVIVVAAMSMVAASGFRSALSGWGFAGSAAIGVLGASAVVLVAANRRLLLGESVALSALGFVLLGGVAVGGLPTPGAYGDFARGLIDGWADLLSSSPPADITVQLRALPFTVAWLAAAIGGEIARHSRRPGLPAIGPILSLVLSLLFTVEDRQIALAQGAGIVAGALVLIGLAQRLARPTLARVVGDEFDAAAASTNRRRLLLGAVVMVGAVAAAPALGPRLPLADAHERFDLRRYQVPPFDPLALPSPLVQVKAALKENRRDDVMFVVSGEQMMERWPVAVLSDYDGVVWTVADPDANRAAAEFAPVDTELPETERTVPDGSATTQHTVEIRSLGGYFLPMPGVGQRLRFEADPDPRMNLTTGSVAIPSGLPEGFAYEVTSAVPPSVTEAQLTNAAVGSDDRSDELELLPPAVRNLAADLVQGEARGWPQLAAIRDAFVEDGYYDVTDDTQPGHSYGRIGTMLQDPERVVGYEEQYAAAAAVMARTADLPVRVVVGYRIPPDLVDQERVEVLASHVSAWLEIDAGELGWIPVDVTPDRSRTPDPESQGSTTQEVAIPNPPPPPPPPPEVQPPRQEDEDIEEEEEFEPVSHEFELGGPNTAMWVAAGAGGGPLLLFVLFATTVVAWKALRRRRRLRRRSTVGQVAGAWAEAVDRAVESGAPLRVRTTPREAVDGYLVQRGDMRPVEPELRRLAAQVDRATYSATPPTSDHVTVSWECSDRVAGELRGRRRLPSRIKMRLDPRPLRRDQVKAGSRS